MASRTEVRDDYEKGVQILRSGAPLGGSKDPAFFMLPLSIANSRAKPMLLGRLTRQPHVFPDFDSLSVEETFAVEIMRSVILKIGKPKDQHPGLLFDISALECELNDLISNPISKGKRKQRALSPGTSIIQKVKANGVPDPAGPKTTTTIENFDWLEANIDPDLWHDIVRHANYDLECTEAFIRWVINRPECDRATAAALFIGMDGERQICDQASVPASGEHKLNFDMVARICERSELGDGFPRSELSLSGFGYSNDQRSLLHRMENKVQSMSVPLRFPVPAKLLSQPFKEKSSSTSFVFLEETLIENRW